MARSNHLYVKTGTATVTAARVDVTRDSGITPSYRTILRNAGAVALLYSFDGNASNYASLAAGAIAEPIEGDLWFLYLKTGSSTADYELVCAAC